MYVSRHALASIAKSKNVPISVISEGMGHDSEATTRIYLASLDTMAIDKANSMILKSLWVKDCWANCKVSLEERTYLFGREMITAAKLHIFRQMEPIYTKKCYAKFWFCSGKKQIVERMNYPHSTKLLIFNRDMLHKSLFQREVTYNSDLCALRNIV